MKLAILIFILLFTSCNCCEDLEPLNGAVVTSKWIQTNFNGKTTSYYYYFKLNVNGHINTIRMDCYYDSYQVGDTINSFIKSYPKQDQDNKTGRGAIIFGIFILIASPITSSILYKKGLSEASSFWDGIYAGNKYFIFFFINVISTFAAIGLILLVVGWIIGLCM